MINKKLGLIFNFFLTSFLLETLVSSEGFAATPSSGKTGLQSHALVRPGGVPHPESLPHKPPVVPTHTPFVPFNAPHSITALGKTSHGSTPGHSESLLGGGAPHTSGRSSGRERTIPPPQPTNLSSVTNNSRTSGGTPPSHPTTPAITASPAVSSEVTRAAVTASSVATPSNLTSAPTQNLSTPPLNLSPVDVALTRSPTLATPGVGLNY